TALGEDDGGGVDGQAADAGAAVVGEGEAGQGFAVTGQVEGAGPALVGHPGRAGRRQRVEAGRAGGVDDGGGVGADLQPDPPRAAGGDEAAFGVAHPEDQEGRVRVHAVQPALDAPGAVGGGEQGTASGAEAAGQVEDVVLA